MAAPQIPPPPPGPRPKVSVVTAAWNALPGLKATAASVAAQGFPDVEHVVVDGGSTDGTAEWLAAQPGIRWISEPDRGIGDAMNKGVAMARGEWILALHAEDTFVDASALARAAEAMDEDADILSCDVLFTSGAEGRRLLSGGFGAKMEFKTVIPHQGAFCRRALFERIGGFDLSFRIAMDFDFFLRAKRRGARLRRAPFVVSRMPDTGVSSRLDWPSLAARFAEERRVHFAHCPGPAMRAVYTAYWPPYLLYRRLRAALRGAARG